MREAIVVGAGIGGLAAAKGLVDAGWRVTVLEEDAALREVGAGIGLSANGLVALDALDLGDAVRAVAVAALPQGTRTAQGTRLQGPAEFASSAVHGIHRTTLHRILADAARDAEIVTGAHVVRVHPGSRARVTTVEGGEQRERVADLVVGADGIDSLVRAAIRTDLPVDYSGSTCWRGVVARRPDSPAGFLQWFGAGSEVGLVPIDGDRVYWYVAARARMGRTARDEHAAATDAVRGFEELVRAHVAAEPETPVLRHDMRYLPTGLRTFVAPGVALLGDAAHAMLPTMGQGAASALEDAATLGVLAARDDVDDLLGAYDRLRRPRTQRLQQLSHRLYRSGMEVRNPVLAAARNGVIHLAPTLLAEIAADWMLRWSPPRR
ncbi:FAD-dependent monooxygenase [Agrococcus jejuensis]|uniref:2-polyprenyl-6-methoxyphenol hydroxylase n=1 Tax=Agrococcus jejuensis TaxID=399736 RepID=A0A1G8CNW3_9MICO|nr:FAD-dependent monooxygenase [Agrococcus jejuensis]SDH47237.1 2-polyprenyl-6-methoxyphenol hydroxylase [Agrococcus jejuensis]